MPVLNITTNRTVNSSAQTLKRLSSGVAQLLGKPESYVMVIVQHQPQMLFAGSDEPLAYVELKSIALPQQDTPDFSATLCDLIAAELDIPRSRIYIEFSDLQRHLFGWNGRTF
ncbi:MAG: phenylpyruvate tautomerase MIF-related protein [Pseudomonadota bacterium]